MRLCGTTDCAAWWRRRWVDRKRRCVARKTEVIESDAARGIPGGALRLYFFIGCVEQPRAGLQLGGIQPTSIILCKPHRDRERDTNTKRRERERDFMTSPELALRW